MTHTAVEILSTAEEILFEEHNIPLSEASAVQLHECVGKAVTGLIARDWYDSRLAHLDTRRVCYLSAEYLIGRLVYSNLYNLGVLDELKPLMAEKGVDLACLEDIEDASLGNGGLGRLAACFLDSTATKNLPVDGYGLRYQFGLFRQSFRDGEQLESADEWLRDGDPWSQRRYGQALRVEFADQTVMAVPYDMPIIGYGTDHVCTLRLWQCEPLNYLDFHAYSRHDFDNASREMNMAEDITKVLYPNDDGLEGKRLRLKQQYFLCSATLQDVYGKFIKRGGKPEDFGKLHALQLNDTHPVLAIPELMRLMMAGGADFAQALDAARESFSYTNHTVMSEALESWDLDLMYSVCPQCADIIVKISRWCLAELKSLGLSGEKRAAMAIVSGQRVHMARLAAYVCRHTNGVAALHTEILKTQLFAPWYALWPERFVNVTNGVTQRRWLGLSNPRLSALIASRIGRGFMTELSQLSGLSDYIGPELAREFNAVKRENKAELSEYINKREGVLLPPDFIFDVQIKRLHEYKRQLLNALSIMDMYLSIKDGSLADLPPTAFIFGGKAASGYARAKAVIRYINRIAGLVNSDPEASRFMRVVFVTNYNCSYAERIIPAADLSEQISPAGTEASGTGNMKLMLSGALTLGTLDGANVEIAESAGMENCYIFGATVREAEALKTDYDSRRLYNDNPRLRRVLDTLVDGTVETDDGLRELHSSLLYGASWHKPDNYLLLHDFESYRSAKLRALHDYTDREAFGVKALKNIAAAGRFSSDRSVTDYAEKIWIIPAK